MILSKKDIKAEHIIIVGKKVFFCFNGLANDILSYKKIEYNKLISIASDKNQMIIKRDGKFDVFDKNLLLVNSFNFQDVKLNSGFKILGKNIFVLLNFVNGYDCTIITNYQITIKIHNFWGEVLNQNYRLNFPEDTFSNPTKFSCSDLLGNIVHWEYDCGAGFKADRFYLFNESVLFVKGGEKGAILLQIELKTGTIIYETQLEHGAFNFDEDRGLLISVWGSESQGKNYQIVDLNLQTVESGVIVSDVVFDNVNVHWQLQFVHENNLFFIDNKHSYGDDTVPIKFGCFDIANKKVIFSQEIPLEYGIQASQIIYNEDKLYIRMTENTLLIYENE